MTLFHLLPPHSCPSSHSSQIIPSLLIVLDDFATPRVQTHAGAALVNFCEQCPKSILTKYLESIVPKLENVLQVKLQEVRGFPKW